MSLEATTGIHPLSSQGSRRARRRLGVGKPGGPTRAWALKVAACLTAEDSGDSPLLPTPSCPHPHLCSLAFGSLALQETASSLTSSAVSSPQGHPQFSFPFTNPHSQSLCTAQNSLCPRAGPAHQIFVATHKPRLLSWKGLAEFIISRPLPSTQRLGQDVVEVVGGELGSITGRAQRSSSHASHWYVFQAHPVSCPCHSPSHALWAKLSPLTWPQHFHTTHTLAELP